jgi:hypothetical protein
MQTTDGVTLIADPDPKTSIRTKSQRQKNCEILVDHSRVLVSIKSVEENNDAIRSPVLLSQYPELHGHCGREPRFIWKDPSEVSHWTTRVLDLKMKPCASAWFFTRILALNQEYQTDPKKTRHHLQRFIERTDGTHDYIAWVSRGALIAVQI